MQSSYVKWLRWLLIGGLFFSLLIPFIIANGDIFPNMFFPFITGKNFAFRILVEILFGLYVLLALREPKYRPRFSWVLGAVVLFTAWVGIATIFSVDPTKSFWSNFERMEGYITILHLFLYFFIASMVLTTEKLWTNYFRGSLAASLLMSVYGGLQMLGKIPIDQGGVRLDGTLGNAIYLAVYMLFNIGFGFMLMYHDWSNKTLRYLYAVLILIDAFMLFATDTRGTILGLVGGIIVACLYFLFAARHDAALKGLWKTSIGVIIAVVVITLGVFAARNVSFIRSLPGIGRVASISLSDPETTARINIWGMAFEGFKDKPVFGWGMDNFNFVFNKYYDPTLWGQEQWFDRAHNAFLDWLSNAGALGFLLFISLFGTAAYAVWRSRNLSIPERGILLGLIAGYAFHEIFVFDNIVSYIQFFTVLALAHGLTQREVPRTVWLSRPLSQKGMAIAVPIVAVLAFGGAYVINAQGIENATGLIQAITPPASGNPADLSQNLSTFQTILANGALGKQEITEQLLSFTPSVVQSSAAPELKQEFFTTALSAIQEMVKERPGDARLELFYGAFLDTFGQYPAALQQLQLAEQASPEKQQILFEIGMNNLIPSGDYKNALSVLQEAYQLDTTYDDAASYYAAALYYDGMSAEADALVQAHFGTLTPNNDTLLQVYFQTKQYARAEQILQNRVVTNPMDSQSWLQLAAVYYNASDTPMAITTLQKAAKADPSVASEAEALVAQLQPAK